MELRYQVSPSEAGTVVDGLGRAGYEAALANRALGSSVDTVVVTGVGPDGADALDSVVTGLDATATRLG